MKDRFFTFILDWKYLVILLSVLISAALGTGIQKLEFSNDYRMFFSKENPQLTAFEQLQDTYSKNDNVLFVLVPKDGQVFTRETLKAVRELTQEAWQLPYSLRVDSVSNFQYTYAEGDDLVVEDLVTDPGILSDQELDTKRHPRLCVARTQLNRALVGRHRFA